MDPTHAEPSPARLRASSLPPPLAPRARRRLGRGLTLLSILAATSLGAAAGCQRTTPAAPVAAASEPGVKPAPSPPLAGAFVAPLAQPVQAPGTGDVASLVDRLKPTVVNITTSRAVARTSAPGPFGNPFGGPMPGGPGEQGPGRAHALGTGFIVDPAGYVVTNAHVVEEADDIKIRLADEREFPAKVVGRDAKLDLALLRIEGASGLSAAVLGDSDALRVGESVLAIGNPFGLGHTVTLGITSAKDRSIGAGPYDAFIQTDASINPGNSGGALFNLRGEVVGIPTAIRQGAQGIGFAVPVNALKDVLPQLRDTGTVSRGKLGVHIQEVTADLASSFGLDRARGALVADVEPNSAGARAGLAPGDIIEKVAGAAVGHAEELPRLVARHGPGSKLTLGVLRDGKPLSLDATLDALVDEAEPRAAAPSAEPQPSTPRGKLGLMLESLPEGGVRVRGLSPDSPALGQLAPGDLIEEVNRRPVHSAAEVARAVASASPQELLLFRVRHDRAERFVALRPRG